MNEILQPPGWPRPKGYSNGIAARGQMVFVGGQIGWDESEVLVSDDLAEQVRQVLLNTVAVLKADHLARTAAERSESPSSRAISLARSTR